MSSEPTPAEAWEARYAEKSQIWSGKPNVALTDVVKDFTPGRALELACGEGADAIWLAEQGWIVHAVDISPTAIQRGRVQAEKVGVDKSISFEVADLTDWVANGEFDLVTAIFLHSKSELNRNQILKNALGALAPGGALLIVGHAEFPPWGKAKHQENEHDHEPLPTNAEVIEQLDLTDSFAVELNENRTRFATGPEGQVGELTDGIVLIRRVGN